MSIRFSNHFMPAKKERVGCSHSHVATSTTTSRSTSHLVMLSTPPPPHATPTRPAIQGPPQEFHIGWIISWPFLSSNRGLEKEGRCAADHLTSFILILMKFRCRDITGFGMLLPIQICNNLHPSHSPSIHHKTLLFIDFTSQRPLRGMLSRGVRLRMVGWR